MKERYISLLTSIKRPGVDRLIEYMEEQGFFEAPCSTQYHLAKEGGLLEHSLNVYEVMDTLARRLLKDDSAKIWKSVIVCSLLHDLGKAGQFGKPGYVENYVDSRKRDENGNKIMTRSTAKPYVSNVDLFNIPHEVRSVVIANTYIDLTEEEQFAILYHNGLYGDFKYEIQGKETPLYLLLHMADMWCARVVEEEKKEGGNE